MIPFLPQAHVEIRINTSRREADEKIGCDLLLRCFLCAVALGQNVWKTLEKREDGEISVKASQVAFDQVAERIEMFCMFGAIRPVTIRSNATQSSLSNRATSLLGSSVTLFRATQPETLYKSYTIKRRQCDKIIESFTVDYNPQLT